MENKVIVVDVLTGEVLFECGDRSECHKWILQNCGEPLSDGRIIYRTWTDKLWEQDADFYDMGRRTVAIV